jgi:hypothetical protein
MGIQKALVRGRTLPRVDGETREELSRLYDAEFDELEACLEIDLNCWRA